MTLLGDGLSLTLIAMAIVTALCWKRAWYPAVTSALAFTLTPLIVKLIKVLVARERPNADLYAGVESFSFPSGHMTNSMVVYGTLAIFAATALSGRLRICAVSGLCLLIACIGGSRVYLGAHWPSDVIAAVLLATVVLLVVGWSFSKAPVGKGMNRAFGWVALFVTGAWIIYGAVEIGAAVSLYEIEIDAEGTADPVVK